MNLFEIKDTYNSSVGTNKRSYFTSIVSQMQPVVLYKGY